MPKIKPKILSIQVLNGYQLTRKRKIDSGKVNDNYEKKSKIESEVNCSKQSETTKKGKKLIYVIPFISQLKFFNIL